MIYATQQKLVFLLASLATLTFAVFPSTTHVHVPKDSFEPVQIRTAFFGATGMITSWNTFAKLPTTSVQYGLSPDNLRFVSSPENAESVTYPTSLTFNNHVKLTNLSPNTKYFWKPSFSNDTSIFSFTTSREAGDHTPYTIAIAVDLGLIGPNGLSTTVGTGAANPLQPGEINTIQALVMDKDNFEFILHPGDIAYADYWLKEELQGFLPNTSIADGFHVYESLLNQFYDEMTPLTSEKPWMVGPGNHEANCDNGGFRGFDATICMPGQTNFTGYRNHFRMPSGNSGGLQNFWYSFDYGMVHYTIFDTETDLGHGLIGPDQPGGSEVTEDSGPFGLKNQQINFLERDLATVDRSKTPWVIAAGHRPWYISGEMCPECQQAFETTLAKHNVDIVLSGHVHFSERTAPIFNSTVDPNELNNPKFPIYITNGAAGHYDGLDPVNSPLAPYSRFAQDQHYATSRITFHNCTHLTHEIVRSLDGAVLDSATLFKKRTCPSKSSGGDDEHD